MAHNRKNGFTLVELIVTIAVVAILLTIGVPSFVGTLRSNRVSTAANELVASFALARTEAMRNPGGAVVCASSDGSSCGTNWDDGWMVWIDANGDGIKATDDRTIRAVTANPRLDLSAVVGGGSSTIVRFDTRGRIRDNTPTGFVITMRPTDCPVGRDLVRTFSLSPTGRVQSTKGVCA